MVVILTYLGLGHAGIGNCEDQIPPEALPNSYIIHGHKTPSNIQAATLLLIAMAERAHREFIKMW